MRFSAMGDAAMTVPVIKAVLRQNPTLKITFVSKPLFAAMFKDIPRLSFFAVDFEGRHKGFAGLWRLFRDLRPLNIDALADLHNNIRSQILSKFFMLAGKTIVHLDKERSDKKKAVRLKNKELKPLKHNTERYADVFRKLGFTVTLSHHLERVHPRENLKLDQFSGVKSCSWLGISPFAQHIGKIYPAEKMEELIGLLSPKDIKIFLFGGGSQEQEICEAWEKKFGNVVSTVSRISLEEELDLIAKLDVMLSMDSAGMHLASMQGVPAVSVWGSTHPFLGFHGYGQPEENIVQNPIGCRPCSRYGKTPCYRPERDYACLNWITPQEILERLLPYVSE